MSPKRRPVHASDVPSVGLVFCVEPGQLEAQALLLARSIRKWTGRFAEAPVLAYRPRPGPPLDSATYASFDELRVEVVEEPLNEEFAHYPWGNKVFAMADAERRLDTTTVVFVDSDSMFLNPPDELDLDEVTDVAVQPVVKKNRGSTGPGDPLDDYWMEAFRIFDVALPPYVETMQDRQRIRAYYNSGLVAFRRGVGLGDLWLEFMGRVLRREMYPGGAINNVDQISLAGVAATRDFGRIHLLSAPYNYAIPRRALFSGPMGTLAIDDMIHVHYHRWFNRPRFLELLEPPIDTSDERVAWLNSFLPFEPTISEPLRGTPERKDWEADRRRRRRADRIGRRAGEASVQESSE